MTLVTMIAINVNQSWQPCSSEGAEIRLLISFLEQSWFPNFSLSWLWSIHVILSDTARGYQGRNLGFEMDGVQLTPLS